MLQTRDLVHRSIRRFFQRRDFMEVQTPVCVSTPAMEEHIDAIRAGEMFLRTSPELHMKRLLCDGCERIFQIGPCFRAGERGRLHSPEFTMLEWYRANADYLDILEDTQQLILEIAEIVTDGNLLQYQDRTIDLSLPWPQYTVAEAFETFAGWDPVADYDPDRFEMDLVEKVEPRLDGDRPAVLIDYPAPLSALARTRDANPAVAERWELYIGGLELANAYTELNDPEEQRRRFASWGAKRASRGQEVYPVDEEFMRALEHGMPPSAGIALGVDRLVMLFADQVDIDSVLAFNPRKSS